MWSITVPSVSFVWQCCMYHSCVALYSAWWWARYVLMVKHCCLSVLQILIASNEEEFTLAIGPLEEFIDSAGCTTLALSFHNNKTLVHNLCHFHVVARNAVAVDQWVNYVYSTVIAHWKQFKAFITLSRWHVSWPAKLFSQSANTKLCL